MTVHTRQDRLKRWATVGGRDAAMFVNGSGLWHLASCMLTHTDASLISAFVERWQPETNSFHMPWGEMTITLHDVYYILGLQITGDMVMHEVDTSTIVAALSEHLLVSSAEIKAEIRSGGLKAVLLQQRTSQAHVSEQSKAILYLLHLLSSTVFVDKTQDRVSAFIYPLLEDLGCIKDYAWGAAVLAYQYRQLGLASRSECRQFSGCATLLEVIYI